MLRPITAYHPEVEVRRESGEVVTIEIDMDDWYTNQEIIEKLLQSSGGRTLGDVVESIEGGRFNLDLHIGIACARVRNKVSARPTIAAGWSDSRFNGT